MKLLDLYSGAGIAAIGYQQAGFHVTGVDNEIKSCYAGDTWINGDALEILSDLSFCRQFDAIHASPPCQKFSKSTAMFRAQGKVYPDLIQPTRELLQKIGLPYVIENVPTAPVRPDVVLKGFMFGLNVIRKRHFELGNWWMMQPGIPFKIGSLKSGDYSTIIGKGSYRNCKSLPKGHRPKHDKGSVVKTWMYAMGIPDGYIFRDVEISEGIPPAYTRYIGCNLIEFLERD